MFVWVSKCVLYGESQNTGLNVNKSIAYRFNTALIPCYAALHMGYNCLVEPFLTTQLIRIRLALRQK